MSAQTASQQPQEPVLSFPWPEPPAIGETIEVAPGILWARLPLPMALDHVNIYALDDGDGWTLIDTGLAWKKGRAAMNALLQGPLAGKPLRRVLMTHHHPDHVGLVGDFARQGSEILATKIAWLTARMLTLDKQETASPEQILFRQRAGVTGAALDAYRAERPFNFADCVAPIPLGFTPVEEGDNLMIGGRVWRVRLGHGHAPHHITLWSEDGIVLAGDQILPGISPNIGVYPTEPEADPLGEWLESCRRLKQYADNAFLVLPGHKRPFRGIRFRLDQLIENHESALDRIRLALARTPMNASEICPDLFRRPIGEGEFGLALVEAIAHLNFLHRRGETRRELDEQGTWRYRAVRE